jgi:hypothetical protein
MNDENFAYVFSVIGKPVSLSRITDKELQAVSGLLPAAMTAFMKEFGRCQFLDGMLSVVHPGDLQSLLDLLFEGDKDLGGKKTLPFAYSIFGTVYFWNDQLGLGDVNLVTGHVTCDEIVNPNPDRTYLENTVYVPFMLEKESHDLFDDANKPLFKRALKKLGRAGFLECYGFVPGLALGGKAILGNLQRRSAPEHFATLAQATEFTIVRSDDFGQLSAVRKVGWQ